MQTSGSHPPDGLAWLGPPGDGWVVKQKKGAPKCIGTGCVPGRTQCRVKEEMARRLRSPGAAEREGHWSAGEVRVLADEVLISTL